MLKDQYRKREVAGQCLQKPGFSEKPGFLVSPFLI
jgi:hypothetical protein